MYVYVGIASATAQGDVAAVGAAEGAAVHHHLGPRDHQAHGGTPLQGKHSSTSPCDTWLYF